MNRLQRLRRAGVSIWLDTLSRDLLDSGAFARLISDSAVTGATSNPTIFAKAITGSDRYDDQLRDAAAAGIESPQALFFELALDDVRQAADLLRPAYDGSQGRDGFVSFECTPDLADDTAATVAQAIELWSRLARPNAMIKVPATAAGIPAIEELTAAGVNVNVTLLFSVERYEQVIDAYIAGLERRLAAGQAVASIASVASFFVSRVDTKADALLPADSALRGRVAVANAQRAYARYSTRFAGGRWRPLRDAGAHPQRPLWASTATKNPAYSDVLYVEQLIAPDVINTMPEATLRAFADHGEIGRRMDADLRDSEETLRRAEAAGIDLRALAAELEREGVRSFCDSYRELLSCIEAKVPSRAAPSLPLSVGGRLGDMQSFHEGQLVTIVEEREALEGIVVHAPSLVKVEVAVPDTGHGPVFRTVHPKLLRDRSVPGEHDDALRRLIRRTASAGRGGPRSGAGAAQRGHSHASGHRTTGK